MKMATEIELMSVVEALEAELEEARRNYTAPARNRGWKEYHKGYLTDVPDSPIETRLKAAYAALNQFRLDNRIQAEFPVDPQGDVYAVFENDDYRQFCGRTLEYAKREINYCPPSFGNVIRFEVRNANHAV